MFRKLFIFVTSENHWLKRLRIPNAKVAAVSGGLTVEAAAIIRSKRSCTRYEIRPTSEYEAPLHPITVFKMAMSKRVLLLSK